MPSLRQLDRSGRQPTPQPPACRACGSKMRLVRINPSGPSYTNLDSCLRLRPLRRDHQQFGDALRMIGPPSGRYIDPWR